MNEKASCGGEQSMLWGIRYYSTNDYSEIHRNGGVRFCFSKSYGYWTLNLKHLKHNWS